MVRALNATAPNQEIIAESTTNYALFTGKLTQEFNAIRRIIGAYPKNIAGAKHWPRPRRCWIKSSRLINHKRPSARGADLQLAGEHEKANQQVNLLNDLQRTVQNQRESGTMENGGVDHCRRGRPPSNASSVCSG